MDVLTVPPPVREKLGEAGSDGLVTMFTDAHRLSTASFERRVVEASTSFDRRITEASVSFDRKITEASVSFDRKVADASASFERRLGQETSKLRLEMAALKFDLLKWNFLFWVGQLAAMTAIMSLLLRGVR
jgi:hypothetical protein